jgi:uncharacterized protein
MKFLLVVLVVAVGLWFLLGRSQGRGGGRVKSDARPGRVNRPASAEPQAMVSCAHCGVHLPQTEALQHEGQAYCSEAHRIAGPAR